MEVTVYCLYSVLCYLAFFIHHRRQDDTARIDHILFGIITGILFIALAVMSMKIEFIFSNGQNMSYTTVTEDLITNNWQMGLFIVYIFLGFLEIIYAIMDALDWRKEKQRLEEEG